MGLGLAVDLGLDQRGIDVTRADRVAGDALFGGLQRRDLGQADDAISLIAAGLVMSAGE